MNKELSKCCLSPVRIAHGCDSDFGHAGKCDCFKKGGVTCWNECTKCDEICDVEPNFICGKCEQEAGKYPNGERLLKHTRTCPKRKELSSKCKGGCSKCLFENDSGVTCIKRYCECHKHMQSSPKLGKPMQNEELPMQCKCNCHPNGRELGNCNHCECMPEDETEQIDPKWENKPHKDCELCPKEEQDWETDFMKTFTMKGYIGVTSKAPQAYIDFIRQVVKKAKEEPCERLCICGSCLEAMSQIKTRALEEAYQEKNSEFIELLNTLNQTQDYCFRCGAGRLEEKTYENIFCNVDGKPYPQHLYTLGPKQWKERALKQFKRTITKKEND